eukprot:TRINITY_DN38139_c0_g1_i1.p1 TRINITY_DN38139_c0_g1~~TRINITY_DN38139_c0_g1_i1.p1  ORF type:complete len:409 (+),score=77.83 TRINITY_DN38139_c0_g1_i1:74-1300(+)
MTGPKQRRSSLLSLAAVALWTAPAVAEPQPPMLNETQEGRRLQPTERTPEQQKNADIASCVFDVLHGATYLTQAGTAIDSSTRRCQTKCVMGTHACGGQQQALCSVGVTEVIESMLFAASFLSFAGADCPAAGFMPPRCAGEVLSLIAALGDLAQAGSGTSYDCPNANNHPGRRLEDKDFEVPRPETEGYYWKDVEMERPGPDLQELLKLNASMAEWLEKTSPDARRLWSAPQNPYWQNTGLWTRPNRPAPPQQTPQERNFHEQNAFCGIYAAQGAWFLARAGLEINLIKDDCRNMFNGGILVGYTDAEKARCIGTFGNVLTSVVYVASYIAGAASQCMHGSNVMAGCIADLTKLNGALGKVAKSAARMSYECSGTSFPTPAPTVAPPATPRRLTEEERSDDATEVLV